MSERWKMNRIGFVNFWLYDEEDFEFEDGKLLLRGQNGSGKSITTPPDGILFFGRRGQGGVYRLSVSGILERGFRRISYHRNRSEGKTWETDGFLGLRDSGRTQSRI